MTLVDLPDLGCLTFGSSFYSAFVTFSVLILWDQGWHVVVVERLFYVIRHFLCLSLGLPSHISGVRARHVRVSWPSHGNQCYFLKTSSPFYSVVSHVYLSQVIGVVCCI